MARRSSSDHLWLRAEAFAKQPVYFAHIPKAAGTTFIHLLDRYFHVDDICPAQLWWQLDEIEEGEQFGLLRGHFGGAGPRLASSPTVVTMLRDPVALLASTLAFIRREPEARFHRNAKELVTQEFLRTADGATALQNRQVSHLAFDLSSGESMVDQLFSRRSAQSVRRRVDSHPGLSADERLALAWDRVEGAAYFGWLTDSLKV